MILVFELSMPGRASWNGRWSGEDRYYAVLRSFKTKAAVERATEILARGSYFYNWPDGWGARIVVRQVQTQAEAARIRKKSNGFCGYEWMVESILEIGKILADHERDDLRKAVAT